MAQGGVIALGASLVVAALVGSFVILPALGFDPTGLGARLQVDGLLAPAPNPGAGAGVPDPGGIDHGNHTMPPGQTGSGVRTWSVLWRTSGERLPTVTGESKAGASSDAVFEIPTFNVTEAYVNLTWTEQTAPDNWVRTANDTFFLEVAGPHGRTYLSPNASTGVISLRIPGHNPPFGLANVTGATEAEALANLSAQAQVESGWQGTWTVRVVCERAGTYAFDGGVLGPLEPPVGDRPQDDGNAWTLTFEYGAFSASLATASSGGMDHSQHQMG